jgi:hypothetical protein
MPQNNIIQLVAYQNLLDEVADLLWISCNYDNSKSWYVTVRCWIWDRRGLHFFIYICGCNNSARTSVDMWILQYALPRMLHFSIPFRTHSSWYVKTLVRPSVDVTLQYTFQDAQQLIRESFSTLFRGCYTSVYTSGRTAVYTGRLQYALLWMLHFSLHFRTHRSWYVKTSLRYSLHVTLQYALHLHLHVYGSVPLHCTAQWISYTSVRYSHFGKHFSVYLTLQQAPEKSCQN